MNVKIVTLEVTAAKSEAGIETEATAETEVTEETEATAETEVIAETEEWLDETFVVKMIGHRAGIEIFSMAEPIVAEVAAVAVVVVAAMIEVTAMSSQCRWEPAETRALALRRKRRSLHRI